MSPIEQTIRAIVADEVRRALHEPQPTRNGRRNAASEVISADEVAAILGVDRKTIYDYAARGTIPHKRLGKRFLFSRVEVMRWLSPCKDSIGDTR